MTGKSDRRFKGFTLVEMMVVTAIMASILAIAMPSFTQARDTSKAKACQHNLRQILSAKERWAMDNNRGPMDTPGMAELAVPGVYVKGLPQCPSGGSYVVGRLDELPACTVGGIPGDRTAHLIQ
jgi:general secretion pathway protein G